MYQIPNTPRCRAILQTSRQMPMTAKILILLPFLLTVAFRVTFATDDQTLRAIKANGAGEGRDAALKDALRNAVELGVGMYLDTESQVKNSDLISDKILTHSQGYVESFKIIKEIQGTIYRVEILAQVRNMLIRQSLQEAHLVPFEGSSAFANSVTNIQRQKSAATLLSESISDFPNGDYMFNFSSPVIRTERGKTYLDFSGTTAVFQDAHLQKLLQVLGATSKAQDTSDVMQYGRSATHNFSCPSMQSFSGGNYYIYVVVETDVKLQCFSVDPDVFDVAKTATSKLRNYNPIITVALIDNQGRVLYQQNAFAQYDSSINRVWLYPPLLRPEPGPGELRTFYREIKIKKFSVLMDADKLESSTALRVAFCIGESFGRDAPCRVAR